MDTTTVLQIIEMINNKLDNLNDEHAEGSISDSEFYPKWQILIELSDHLQFFIEGELNAAENQSPE